MRFKKNSKEEAMKNYGGLMVRKTKCRGGNFKALAIILSICLTLFGLTIDSFASGSVLKMPVTATPSADGKVTLPITFISNGNQISTVVFSVDYNERLLTFDPSDKNGDDVPDSVTFTLPGGFVGSVTFNSADTDGEIDLLIVDPTPPLSGLRDGILGYVTFSIKKQFRQGDAVVTFSQDPPMSFGNTQGVSIAPGVIETVQDLELAQLQAPGKARDCDRNSKVTVVIRNNGTEEVSGDVVLRKNGVPVKTWNSVMFEVGRTDTTTLEYPCSFSGDAGTTVTWEAEVISADDTIPTNNKKSAATSVTNCRK